MPRHFNDFEKGRIADRLPRGMQIRAIATQFNLPNMEGYLIRKADQVIELLRCSQCEEYLSHGPVGVLPDGTWICGQCASPNSDNVVYRALMLEEAILKNVAFPCRFKMNGCRNKVVFGKAMEHESKCVYQSYHCPLPVPNDETCCWSGLQSEVLDHLTKNHSSCLLQAASFIIQVDQDSQGIFAVLKNDLIFLVAYWYQTSTRNLNYDIRYFSVDESVSASYKMNIQNNNIPDCNVSLKENSCPIFGNCFNKLNNTLNLNKYMEALDNPNGIKVGIILNDTKKKKLALETVEPTLTVDYEKLASLQCMKCHKENLVFPIFDMGNLTICCKCAYKYCKPKESTDMELRQRIAETNFPCCWRSCNFIGTGDVIHTHEIHCQFRDYHCPICSTLIATTFAAKHLQSHGSQHISEGAIALKLKGDNYPQYVFIIQNNKVIIVKHEKVYNVKLGGYYSIKGELLLGTFKDEKVVIQFEYQRCRRKSGDVILSKAVPKVDYWSYGKRLSCQHDENEVLTVKLREYE